MGVWKLSHFSCRSPSIWKENKLQFLVLMRKKTYLYKSNDTRIIKVGQKLKSNEISDEVITSLKPKMVSIISIWELKNSCSTTVQSDAPNALPKTKTGSSTKRSRQVIVGEALIFFTFSDIH